MSGSQAVMGIVNWWRLMKGGYADTVLVIARSLKERYGFLVEKQARLELYPYVS